LDSYALRHAADLNELIVFEVDDPGVQAWKRARFRALRLQASHQRRRPFPVVMLKDSAV
jgi:O-methyltransferase involved in polyketide biosynthesis